jgi:hypothetical protein
MSIEKVEDFKIECKHYSDNLPINTKVCNYCPLTKRSDDYHACLENNTKIWGCGNSQDKAIGDLINAHRDIFNISIKVR